MHHVHNHFIDIKIARIMHRASVNEKGRCGISRSERNKDECELFRHLGCICLNTFHCNKILCSKRFPAHWVLPIGLYVLLHQSPLIDVP